MEYNLIAFAYSFDTCKVTKHALPVKKASHDLIPSMADRFSLFDVLAKVSYTISNRLMIELRTVKYFYN